MSEDNIDEDNIEDNTNVSNVSNISNNIPVVLKKRELVIIERKIGNFRCSGKGNEPVDIFIPPCESLLEITWETIFIQHIFRKSKISFMCPICGNVTDINYKRYRPKQPHGLILPTRSVYVNRVEN